MKKPKTDNTLWCDVDNTLVAFCHQDHFRSIKVDYYGVVKYVKPLHKNIDFLKSLDARGYTILVHSGNGVAWANEIVKALQLEDYVYDTFTKPIKILDNDENDNWMPRPLNIEKEST